MCIYDESIKPEESSSESESASKSGSVSESNSETDAGKTDSTEDHKYDQAKQKDVLSSK